MLTLQNFFANKTNYLILLIVLMFGITIVTRFLPFWIQDVFKRSLLLRRVGDYLPSVIMLLLLLNSLKGVNWTTAPYGLSELVCLALAASLYIWRRNLLLSLVSSAIIYLFLVNFVIQS